MDNRHALSIQQSATLLQERYGVRVSPTTLSHWLDEYKAFCTYARMREKGTALFPPHQLIQANDCTTSRFITTGSTERSWHYSLRSESIAHSRRDRSLTSLPGRRAEPIHGRPITFLFNGVSRYLRKN